MVEQPREKTQEFKFLGGKITLEPAYSFAGRSGPVDVPAKILLKLDGVVTRLSADACDEIANMVNATRAQPFLEKMRAAENDGQSQ